MQRLRAEYEHPRVKEFEFCLQQSFPPERVRCDRCFTFWLLINSLLPDPSPVVSPKPARVQVIPIAASKSSGWCTR